MSKGGHESEGTPGPEGRPVCFMPPPCSRHPARRFLAFVCLPFVLAGCMAGGHKVDQAMQADRGGAAVRSAGAATRYFVGCPDVLELRIEGRHAPGGRLPVGADGRIDLGPLGGLRVEGQMASEIARDVAERAGVPPDRVHVRVAEYNSQRVYLFGEVTGLQRTVTYQGEETVADLLQRAGGITPGAAPAHVHLIRPRVAEGRTPLVYHVDLQAVVLNKDQRTNLRVQPFDQIYVGETHRSSLHKCIPPLLRPFYEAVCGLQKKTRRPGDKETRGQEGMVDGDGSAPVATR